MSAKAIGLFSADDIPQGTWNDNQNNTAGPDIKVTAQQKPKQDNTMLYIAAGLLALVLLTNSK